MFAVGCFSNSKAVKRGLSFVRSSRTRRHLRLGLVGHYQDEGPIATRPLLPGAELTD